MNESPTDPDIARAAADAIDAYGNGAELARHLGVTRFAVNHWKNSGIPPRHVGRMAKLTGRSPEVLRPDLFPGESPLQASPTEPTRPTPAEDAAA